MVLIRPQGSHCLTSITTKGCRKQGTNRWQWIMCLEVDDGCTDEYQQGSQVWGENPFHTAPSGPGCGAVVGLANRGERWQNPGRRCAITHPAPRSIWSAADHGSLLTDQTDDGTGQPDPPLHLQGRFGSSAATCLYSWRSGPKKGKTPADWKLGHTHVCVHTHTYSQWGAMRRQTTDGLSVFCPTQITVSVTQSWTQSETVGGMFQISTVLGWDV